VVHQYVEETDTAFHAGTVVRPTWRLLDPHANPNLYTIGIEHEGLPQNPWPDDLYQTSAKLIREVAGRWAIPLDRDHVIMHREIRASKTCPGSADMERLLREAAAAADPLIRTPIHVKTTARVNLRRLAPTTSAAISATLPAQTDLDAAGFRSDGQAISGNAFWYVTSRNDYIWAGATDRPNPGAPCFSAAQP
jgi:hypothetical protein